MTKLTMKQQLFVEHYIIDFNARKAALAAGYSPASAASTGSENLTKPYIIAEIDKAKRNRLERTQSDSDYVLNRLHQIDQLDVVDILDEDLNLKPITEWPKEWRTSISGVDIKELLLGRGDDRSIESVMKKIKFPDKLKTLELLGRHTKVQSWIPDDGRGDEVQPLNITIGVVDASVPERDPDQGQDSDELDENDPDYGL